MWIEYLRLALTVLRAHKFRALLTVASIVIGAFSIVLMTSLAESGLGTLAASFEELGGSRLISMWPQRPEEMENKQGSYTRGLTQHDAEVVRSVPHVVSLTQFISTRGQPVISDGGTRLNCDLIGADDSFLAFFRYYVSEGRTLDAQDVREHAHSCVIGSDLADKLFGKGEHVVGRVVTVADTRCRIIGRLARLDRWGIGFGWRWDEALVMPVETLADRKPALLKSGRRLFLLTDDPRHNEIVKRIANAVLLERHHNVDDFAMFDFEKRLAGFYRVFFIMKLIVGLLAGISLIVGGVGIMNIMIVSVSERVREIGIRKALGASPADIGRQFLVEAMLLSGIGGAVGAILGVAGAIGGGAVIHMLKPSWRTMISEPAVVVALLSAVIIGLVFGYVPAKSAGRLDPVTAIRT